MTDNLPMSMVNVLSTAFLIIVILGVGVLAYAALQLKKMERFVPTAAAEEPTPEVENDEGEYYIP